MNLIEFENQLKEYCQQWYDKKDLDYLNLETPKFKDVAHNVKIIAYRVDLGNKAIFTLAKQNRIHLQELKRHFQEESVKIDKILELSGIIRSQRASIKQLLQGQEALKEEISSLRREYLARRPLSRQDVKELVLQIAEQPKQVELHTENLARELTLKVKQVEDLIHHLKEVMLA